MAVWSSSKCSICFRRSPLASSAHGESGCSTSATADVRCSCGGEPLGGGPRCWKAQSYVLVSLLHTDMRLRCKLLAQPKNREHGTPLHVVHIHSESHCNELVSIEAGRRLQEIFGPPCMFNTTSQMQREVKPMEGTRLNIKLSPSYSTSVLIIVRGGII